jgi:subtilase family serine protease
VPERVGSSTYAGQMDGEKTLSLSVAFRLNNEDELAQALDSLYDPESPSFHQWLSSKESGSRFGRSSDEIQNAKKWLESRGFHIEHVWPNNLCIFI